MIENRVPIITYHGILIVSLQSELTDKLVLQLKDDISRRIEAGGAVGLVVDVSGIDLMDSYLSRSIRDIGLIARLMGVETVISGIDPGIAMTLTEMGMDLTGVKSNLNLESAVDRLLKKTAGPARKAGERPVKGCIRSKSHDGHPKEKNP
jgi:rsbT antagonist protein RsbS